MRAADTGHGNCPQGSRVRASPVRGATMSSLQWSANGHHVDARGKVWRRIVVLLEWGATMALVACGGGSAPDSAGTADTNEPSAFRAGASSAVVTALLPP